MKNLIGLALGGWLSLLAVTPTWAQTKLKIENVQAAFWTIRSRAKSPRHLSF
jgi:hypothetical protein